jgi:hypothetical protein
METEIIVRAFNANDVFTITSSDNLDFDQNVLSTTVDMKIKNPDNNDYSFILPNASPYWDITPVDTSDVTLKRLLISFKNGIAQSTWLQQSIEIKGKCVFEDSTQSVLEKSCLVTVAAHQPPLKVSVELNMERNELS